MKRLAAAQIQHKFDPSQVIYLTGDVNYSSVYLQNGSVILSSRTLKWYHTRWPHFIRIHKASLINPDYVHSCHVISCIIAQITMQNGAVLPIGRRRIHEVVEELKSSHSAREQWEGYVQPQVQLA
ncbi:LytTR family transcriptional regulator DNA-binding domain-containing protein [Spirosoma gilvum]